ncbi:DNA primase [Pollutibacter soli]|uniref:DNA primase n=1 Tax=Pollutibacter soli TaxID=3034157 RepID=UPI003013E2E2
MIPQQTIQEIQSKIDIIEVVGEFVRLKRRGTNYLGLCPFHNEKTPSFTVSPAKEIYKCFGCGRSGNTIGFLMEHEKYSYVEALRWLANRYGIEIVESETSPEFRQQQQTADSLYILNQFAQKFFSDQLYNAEEGTDIGLSYLKERGFNDETIKKFQLGYNPAARDSFAKAALAAQYSQDLLQKSGLIVIRDNKPADNYHGRIIFPIHNQSGKVLGFGARIIAKNDRAPKYINTPENEIYVKSRILYGSYFARHAIDRENECLLVEGYTDVISLHQAGIENVVASGGTSLTPDQLRLIKKYSNNLTIIYDGDNAGIKAALRGLDLAIEEGLNVQLVLIPDKEDPDSYVRKVGADAFKDFIKSSKKDIILFQVENSLKEAGNDSTRKAALVNQIAETIARLNKAEDFTRQQDYIHRSAELMKIDEAGLTTLVNQFIREKITKEEKKAAKTAPENRTDDATPKVNDGGKDEEALFLIFKDELNERAMVRSLIEFGNKPWDDNQTVADFVFSEMEVNGLYDLLDNKKLLQMIELFKTWYEEGLAPGPKNFLYYEDVQISQLSVDITNTQDEISPKWKEYYDGPMPTREELYKQDVLSSVNYLKLRKIRRMILENQQDLEKNPTGEELLTLLQTHQHLKELEIDLTRLTGTVILR